MLANSLEINGAIYFAIMALWSEFEIQPAAIRLILRERVRNFCRTSQALPGRTSPPRGRDLRLGGRGGLALRLRLSCQRKLSHVGRAGKERCPDRFPVKFGGAGVRLN